MSIGKKTLVASTLVLVVAPAATAAEMPPPSASGLRTSLSGEHARKRIVVDADPAEADTVPVSAAPRPSR